MFNRVPSCYNPASASLYRPTSVRASQIRFRITVLRYSWTCLRKYFCQTGWIMLWLAQHDWNYSSNSSYCLHIPVAFQNSRLKLLLILYRVEDVVEIFVLQFFLLHNDLIIEKWKESKNLEIIYKLEDRSRENLFNRLILIKSQLRYVRANIAITVGNVSLIDTGWVVTTLINS